MDEMSSAPERLQTSNVNLDQIRLSLRRMLYTRERLRYVESFAALRKRGVKLLTKADIIAAPSKIKSHIASINTPYLYVSVDMDIGARNALEGVRFTDRAGLNESQILAITREIGKTLKGKVALAAMDLCEFNPRTELLASAHSQDRTLPIAAEIIKILSEAALSSP